MSSEESGYSDSMAMRRMVQLDGWTLLRRMIDDQIAHNKERLSTETFESIRDVDRIQGTIAALEAVTQMPDAVINRVDRAEIERKRELEEEPELTVKLPRGL